MTTDHHFIALRLDGAIPDHGGQPLIVYLAHRHGAWEGLAHAPSWNKRVHQVDATALRLTGGMPSGTMRVTLLPDEYVPRDGQPVDAVYTLQGEAFTGSCGGTAVAGAVSCTLTPEDAVNPVDCELELWLMDAHRWSGIDWMRTLRVSVEYRGGIPVHARCITKYGEETFAMPFDATTLSLTREGVTGSITVTYPAHPNGPAADHVVIYPLAARIIGAQVGGAYTRTSVEARGAFSEDGWLRGRLRSMWPVGQPDTTPFRHPGMLTSAEDLAFISRRVAAGREPWASGYARLQEDMAGALAHQPRAMRHYIFIHHSMPGPVRDMMADAQVAYGCALLHALDGDVRYAAKTAEILDAYSDTLREIGPADGILGTAYTWPALIWAAELLRATYAGWTGAERFAQLLRDIVYYPGSTYVVNNNWMSWSICLRMAVAIFTEDRGRFNVAVQDFHDHVADYFAPSGHCRETGRDLWHTQMAIAPLLAAAEMAWKQGVDLYSSHDYRLLAGMEYHLPFIAGDLTEWPNKQEPRAMGEWWPMYELGYNHYHTRCGLVTPHTEARVLDARPEGFGRIGWGTLTHVGMDVG